MNRSMLPFPTDDAFAQLVRQTFLRQVVVLAESPSTNDEAVQRIRTGLSLPTPLLIVAQRQTAGRGRGDHRWWSGPGSVTCSLVVHATDVALEPGRWPLLSLATGIGIRSAIAELVPDALVQLKWPNDVYMNHRKVAGVLVEVPNPARELIVIGIGLNLNNSFSEAPPDIRQRAVTLRDETARRHDFVNVLTQLVRRLESTFDTLAASTRETPTRTSGGAAHNLPALWNPHCFLRGKWVTVTAGPNSTTPGAVDHPGNEKHLLYGVVQGIDHDGALLVQGLEGLQRCVAGVVEWREE